MGRGAILARVTSSRDRRQRIQMQVVDRRFNRARYDADQTVAAFAARLKDTVDLYSVRDDLATVIDRALAPAHVSVWISKPSTTAQPAWRHVILDRAGNCTIRMFSAVCLPAACPSLNEPSWPTPGRSTSPGIVVTQRYGIVTISALADAVGRSGAPIADHRISPG